MAAASSPSSLSTLLSLLFSKWASLEEQSMKIVPFASIQIIRKHLWQHMSDKY